MSAPTLVTMRTALTEPRYFAEGFAGASWDKWRVLLLAIAGEELTPDELVVFQALTNRQTAPTAPVGEFWGVVGRRGGKSRASAVLAAWLASCRDYRGILAPGERGQVQILSTTRDTSANIFNFIVGAFESSRALRGLVSGKTAEVLSLKCNIDVVVRPASFRSTRGSTAVAILADELAYWRSDDSACPDEEVLRAVRPSLLTTKGPLIAISSPYSRKGELWKAYCKHWGQESNRVLVVQAATEVMHPTVDTDYIAAKYEEDAIGAAAEYGASFRTSIEAFVSQEVVDSAVIPGRHELPPQASVVYSAFIDTSGGSSESMTCAIAHRDADGIAILDAVREARAPFSPDIVTEEFAAFLRSYGIQRATGDNYGGEFPPERFRAHGIAYEQSSRTKSDIYRDMLPLINSGRAALLDNPRLIAQLLNLERRTTRGGKEIIDHPKVAGMHDDIINAAAGALVNISYERAPQILRYQDFLEGGEPVDVPTASCYRRFRSMACDRDGRAAVISWLACGVLDPNLVLCDFECGYFVDLKRAPSLLGKCVAMCSSGARVVAVCEGLYEVSDKDFMREFSAAAAAARAVAGGRVKVSCHAHMKSESAAIGAALDFTIDKLNEPLTAAAICGIYKLLISA
jgi:hypothetical protein